MLHPAYCQKSLYLAICIAEFLIRICVGNLLMISCLNNLPGCAEDCSVVSVSPEGALPPREKRNLDFLSWGTGNERLLWDLLSLSGICKLDTSNILGTTAQGVTIFLGNIFFATAQPKTSLAANRCPIHHYGQLFVITFQAAIIFSSTSPLHFSLPDQTSSSALALPAAACLGLTVLGTFQWTDFSTSVLQLTTDKKP